MKTLYISDLDGTLLNKDTQVSKFTRDTINKCVDKGAIFSVATARTIATVSRLLEGVHINAPVILMNGALVYDMQQKKYLKTEGIAEDSTAKVIDSMHAHDMTGFMYTIEDGLLHTYYEAIDRPCQKEFYEERVTRFQKKFEHVDDFKDLLGRKVVYFSIFSTKEELDPIYADICDDPDLAIAYYQDIYSENLWYLEVFSCRASKLHALNWLKDYLQVEYTVGFGDNTNDQPLFEGSDYKVAVANAKKPLIEAADELTERNNDDGVARFLVEHMR